MIIKPFTNLFPILGTRSIIQGRQIGTIKPAEPVKLAFASYEDTKTRDLKELHSVPPLIIMHGLFGSKYNWNTICKALLKRSKPTRKIIAVDARNHGDSNHSNVHNYDALAVDVKHLIESEKLGKVAFMGHSMGGRTGMYFALKYPELVERLIVADISPISTPSDLNTMYKYFHALSTIQIQPGLALSAARSMVDTALLPTIPDRGTRAFLLTNLVKKPNGTIGWRLNLRALKANYQNIAKFPFETNSGVQYLGPVTFIAGSNSDYLQIKDHNGIKRFFPKAIFHTIKGAGHWIHSEKPLEFTELVLNSLNKQARDVHAQVI